jgi:ATP-dependent Clp protease adaptor protein ClpS
MGLFDFEDDSDVVLEEEQELELQKPTMYKVIFHNDDYTTMEFVVFILESVFHKSKTESTKIMLEVHTKGTGIVGIYTKEVASTNIYLVEKLAEEEEFPFRATMEPV